jgi:hypothetical protein
LEAKLSAEVSFRFIGFLVNTSIYEILPHWTLNLLLLVMTVSVCNLGLFVVFVLYDMICPL